MSFRTEIELKPSPYPIGYHTPLLLVGSCFATYIGTQLAAAKLPVTVNPFGVLYNPASIGNNLERLLSPQTFGQTELYHYRDLWLSFSHHGSFSHRNPAICLNGINHAYQTALTALQNARYCVITLGTAFVYRRKDSGAVVANCHQLPDAFFVRDLLSVSDITAIWQPLLRRLFAQQPNLRCIFTLSPIRHWKDGAADNQLSKAILTVAIHELSRLFPQQIDYFPAYELLMDDLRDYRFYEADMLHPNSVAIDYVWHKFKQRYITQPATLKVMTAVAQIAAARQHRPRHPNSQAHQAFAQQTIDQIDALCKQFPELNLEEERTYFIAQL